LTKLEKAGWVKSEKVDGGLESKVYSVSAKAFQQKK
jgi:DNA-binding PadR family transcriptional regulator